MIRSFKTKATEGLYHGHFTGREVLSIPQVIWKTACRKLDLLHAARELRDLASPPANRLEKLEGVYRGLWSIRINEQYRLIFRFEDGNASDVEIIDYH